MTEPLERELDKALRTGEGAEDPRLTDLVRQADQLETELAHEAPSGGRERAVFIQGVALRHRRFLGLRILAPAVVVLTALVAVGGFSRSALPGDTLYPMRQALASVGLAPSSTEEAERRLDAAERALDLANLKVASDPLEAEELSLGAITSVRQAERLLEDVDTERGDDLLDRADDLEDRSLNILERLEERRERAAERAEQRQDRLEEAAEEDNSGPGGGDDDNSGPGSGDDDGDDNSGPGSGDDGGGDDSSGPGSGDDGGGDDSSGSGSGGDGDTDSSGSGSGGDGDSSGSGSGGDGDSSGSGSGGDSSGPGSGEVELSNSGSSGSDDDPDDD